MRTATLASALFLLTACGARPPVVILDQTYVAPDKQATTYSVPYAKGQGDIFIRVCDIGPDGGTRNCKDTKVLGPVGLRTIHQGDAR